MQTFQGKDAAEIKEWLEAKGLVDIFAAKITAPLIPLTDNFTAPTRTPWGGQKILGKYKQGLPIPEGKRYPVVGESWEISADPAAPCEFIFELGRERILLNFIQVLDLFPEQILGSKLSAKFEGQEPILVKILDTDDHLSIQVHPSDCYAGLRPDEAGKPECWFILEAREGGGLYLGLKNGVSEENLRAAIEANEDVSQYLNFVEVKHGDFFTIDAGTIHAIGGGVTLIEPQKIAPKRSGKTYRLWDWNRKYDPQGCKDPLGEPRELHIKDSFEIIDFDAPRGEDFIEHIQPSPRVVRRNGASVETLCVETENFGVSQLLLKDDDALEGDCRESFHGIIPYDGQIEIYAKGEKVAEIPCGQSVILPAVLGSYTLKAKSARALKVYYPEQYLE